MSGLLAGGARQKTLAQFVSSTDDLQVKTVSTKIVAGADALDAVHAVLIVDDSRVDNPYRLRKRF